jgi:hypothetical protein
MLAYIICVFNKFINTVIVHVVINNIYYVHIRDIVNEIELGDIIV